MKKKPKAAGSTTGKGKTATKKTSQELSDDDLAGATGGINQVSAARMPRFAPPGDHSGGQNDPAQMFQQILQQLTQGQS